MGDGMTLHTCTVSSCENPAVKAGFCWGHWKRKMRGLTVDSPLAKRHDDPWDSLVEAALHFAPMALGRLGKKLKAAKSLREKYALIGRLNPVHRAAMEYFVAEEQDAFEEAGHALRAAVEEFGLKAFVRSAIRSGDLSPEATEELKNSLPKRLHAQATQRGMDRSRARGTHVGRPKKRSIEEIVAAVARDGDAKTAASKLGISVRTVFRALKKGQ